MYEKEKDVKLMRRFAEDSTRTYHVFADLDAKWVLYVFHGYVPLSFNFPGVENVPTLSGTNKYEGPNLAMTGDNEAIV